jgi:hypothetical protein
MAVHAPRAAVPTTDHPVQLSFQLRAFRPRGAARVAAPRRPYWTSVDTADVGGDLRARNHCVHVRLDAQAATDGTWTAYYDLLLAQSGVSGPTRPLPTRQDALNSAAYAIAKHCRGLVANPGGQARETVRAAREVIRWLEVLDLL